MSNDQVKIYCGTSNDVPAGYGRFGTRFECMRCGFGSAMMKYKWTAASGDAKPPPRARKGCYRSRSPGKKKARGKSKNSPKKKSKGKGKGKGKSRSRSPKKRKSRSRSPKKRKSRSRSPKKRKSRSRSPKKSKRTSPSRSQINKWINEEIKKKQKKR